MTAILMGLDVGAVLLSTPVAIGLVVVVLGVSDLVDPVLSLLALSPGCHFFVVG